MKIVEQLYWYLDGDGNRVRRKDDAFVDLSKFEEGKIRLKIQYGETMKIDYIDYSSGMDDVGALPPLPKGSKKPDISITDTVHTTKAVQEGRSDTIDERDVLILDLLDDLICQNDESSNPSPLASESVEKDTPRSSSNTITKQIEPTKDQEISSISEEPEKDRDGPERDREPENAEQNTVEYDQGVFYYQTIHGDEKKPKSEEESNDGPVKSSSEESEKPHEHETKQGYILFSFTASGDDELTIVAGETIQLIDYDEGKEWWMGKDEKRGTMGLFPKVYCKVVQGAEQKVTESPQEKQVAILKEVIGEIHPIEEKPPETPEENEKEEKEMSEKTTQTKTEMTQKKKSIESLQEEKEEAKDLTITAVSGGEKEEFKKRKEKLPPGKQEEKTTQAGKRESQEKVADKKDNSDPINADEEVKFLQRELKKLEEETEEKGKEKMDKKSHKEDRKSPKKENEKEKKEPQTPPKSPHSGSRKLSTTLPKQTKAKSSKDLKKRKKLKLSKRSLTTSINIRQEKKKGKSSRRKTRLTSSPEKKDSHPVAILDISIPNTFHL